MNIVCSTDDNFVQHCTIMLTSVLLHNSDVTVWVLSEGLTVKNQKILKDEIEDKRGIFKYLEVDSEIISRLPMPNDGMLSHISPATYYRLLVTEILPESVRKAIYLDCDIIVRGSLSALLHTDIEKYAVGAVHQMWQESEDAQRLGYDARFGYFNAGVLLINLDYWRMNAISSKLVEYLTTNYDSILMHDQDALNAILHDKSLKLETKWNMLHYFFSHDSKSVKALIDGKVINDFLEYKLQLKINRKNPTVIHYVSKPKPWQKGCSHPFVMEYFFYSCKTLNFNNLEFPNKIKLKAQIIFNDYIIYIKWKLRPVFKQFF